MNNNDSHQIIDIPHEFHQDAEGKEFAECTFCEQKLSSEQPYMIEKSFKRNLDSGFKVTVFEYAICMSCSLKKMEAMSEESVQNIQAYMSENVLNELEDRLNNGDDYTSKLRFCPATGNEISSLSEYSLVGQCMGNKMIVGTFPIAIDASIGEEMQNLLSESTKKEFDDFMDTITGIPPELRSLFKSKRPVLV